MITVAVGQFGSVVGRGLLQILNGARGVEVVGSGLSQAALERAVARGRATVVVLDEDGVAGPAVPRRLSEGGADIGLVVLAHRPTRAFATRMLASGVNVCLSTDAPPKEIVRGIRLAAEGGHVFAAMSPRPAAPARGAGIASLTRREREVLEQLSRGHKNAEIAKELQISTETARTHAKRVYRKLGVSSRGELLGMSPVL
jgi:DNA-binding NarL/FixJ family response regulator